MEQLGFSDSLPKLQRRHAITFDMRCLYAHNWMLHSTTLARLIYGHRSQHTSGFTPPEMRYGLDDSLEWATINNEPVLWLPPEVRPWKYLGINSTLILGTRRGKVTVISFDLEVIRNS